MSFWFTVLVIVITVILVMYIPVLFKRRLPIHVGGYTDERFSRVMDAFRDNVESGMERGGAFAVFYKGKLVVDVWGGYADPASEAKWREETIATVFSATKGVAALVVANMVDKGILDYRRLIRDYWPEFGCNGKESITLGMLMSHTAGLVSVSEKIPIRWLKDDIESVTKILEAQKPDWPPGTKVGYHGATYGMYVDILVRKVDPQHRSMGEIFNDEIGRPFDIDFSNGLPLAESYRAATIVPLPSGGLLQALGSWEHLKLFGNMLLNPYSLLAKSFGIIPELAKVHTLNNPHLREVGFSSFMGHATARGLAKMYGILANGGTLHGKQLLSENAITKLNTISSTGICQVKGTTVTFSMGMAVSLPKSGEKFSMGHPGYGGQSAFADLKNNIGLAYITNHLSIHGKNDDPRYLKLQDALYKDLLKL